MIFNTKLAGIPCQCKVIGYSPYVPMRITGSGFGDCDPPELEDIEFEMLDRKGYDAPWLNKKVTPSDESRFMEEYRLQLLGERYGYL